MNVSLVFRSRGPGFTAALLMAEHGALDGAQDTTKPNRGF
jgi:hypothetical protein